MAQICRAIEIVEHIGAIPCHELSAASSLCSPCVDHFFAFQFVAIRRCSLPALVSKLHFGELRQPCFTVLVTERCLEQSNRQPWFICIGCSVSQRILNRTILRIILYRDDQQTQLIGRFYQFRLYLGKTIIDRIGLCTADSNLHAFEGCIVFVPDLLFQLIGEAAILGKHLIPRIFPVVIFKLDPECIAGAALERKLKPNRTIGSLILKYQLAFLQSSKQITHLVLAEYASHAVFQTIQRCSNATLHMTHTICAFSGGRNSKQQHHDFEQAQRILITFNKMQTFLIMLDIRCNFRIFIAKVAFAGEEIIPQPFRGEPACFIIRAVVVDISDKANVRIRLILHKAEHGTLRSSKALRHTRKQPNRHRVDGAQLVDHFAGLVIQTNQIWQEFLEIVDNPIAFISPCVLHTVAHNNRTRNQVQRSRCTDVEFYCVEAVGNHLIAVLAHAIDHLIRTMDNIEHKERLDLAEFRELLHDGVVIAMCNVLGELIPDKEDATLGKTIGINDFCQPIFKRVQIGNQAKLHVPQNHGSRLDGRQLARGNRSAQFFHRRIIITQNRIFNHMIPVDGRIIQPIGHRTDQRCTTQIRFIAKFSNQSFTDSLLSFHQHHVAGADARAACLPDHQIIALVAALHKAITIFGQPRGFRQELVDYVRIFFQQMLYKNSCIAFTSAVRAMHPKRSPGIRGLIAKRLT